GSWTGMPFAGPAAVAVRVLASRVLVRIVRVPPRSPLYPYTTLFRSGELAHLLHQPLEVGIGRVAVELHELVRDGEVDRDPQLDHLPQRPQIVAVVHPRSDERCVGYGG